MPVVTAIAMYVVIWWTALFAVLPLGTKPVADADSQTGWRGVPERPQMLRKVLITTVVAAVLWLVAYVVITSGWISFRSGWMSMHE